MNHKLYQLSNIAFLSLAFYCWTNQLTAQTDTLYIGGGGSNHLNVTVSTSSAEGIKIGENTLGETGLLPNLNAASRFLAQSTLGADYELIEEVSQKGFSTWIEEQFALPYTFSQKDYALAYAQEAYDSLYVRAIRDTTDLPDIVYPHIKFFHSGWTKNVIESPDILRSRVALAWSEIFVISNENDVLSANPLALADYYDMLSAQSFGNFRDLLEVVTFHPAMGNYLTYINNAKSDFSINRFPDENYAREIMQLFTIGLIKLNLDGTPQLDADGNEIETYINQDITQLAKVFTGLSYGDGTTFGADYTDQNSFIQPMTMHDDWHEPGEKQLIEGYTIENRNPVDGMADINEALDHLFHHPNVGPFIGRFMIQRLVKNNPSPGYIARVATAFNDNGQGIRGDLKALIRAVLLDPEARDCALIYRDEVGKLREPLIRYTHLMRAFNLTTASGEYRNDLTYLAPMKQIPLGAPSVFNFFRPNYSPNGLIQNAGKVAPEFQILDDKTAAEYGNFLSSWLFTFDDHQDLIHYGFLRHFDLFMKERASHFNWLDFREIIDFSDEEALSNEEQLEEMIERLNLILVHGRLTATTKNYIIEAIQEMAPNGLRDKVRMAVNLIMISPDYVIFR